MNKLAFQHLFRIIRGVWKPMTIAGGFFSSVVDLISRFMKYWCGFDFLFVASYTGSSSDEDEVNPRDKNQVCVSCT